MEVIDFDVPVLSIYSPLLWVQRSISITYSWARKPALSTSRLTYSGWLLKPSDSVGVKIYFRRFSRDQLLDEIGSNRAKRHAEVLVPESVNNVVAPSRSAYDWQRVWQRWPTPHPHGLF